MRIQLVKILFLVLGSLSLVRNQPSFSANVLTKQYSKLSPFSIVQIQSRAIAFLIDIFGGILTLDLSDPTNPQTLADFTSYQNASVKVTDVLLINSTLLIIELNSDNALIYNVSNPLYIQKTLEYIQIQIDQMLLIDQGWHLLVISNGNVTIYNLNDLYKPIYTGIYLGKNYQIGGKGALNPQQQLLFIPTLTNIMIYNITDLNNLIFISNYAAANMTTIQKLAVHPTQNLLFCMDQQDSIISINYTNIVWPTDQINCNVNYSHCVVAQLSFSVLCPRQDLQLSTDGKSLLLTIYYYGLYQLDIKTLQIMQIVPSTFYSSQFLQMQEYIFLCDQFQLQIISVITFEFSNNFPNLYNSLLIESQSYYFYPSGSIKVFIREEQNQVWLVDQIYGIFVFDVSSGIANIQIISKQKELTQIESIAFLPTDNDLVFCLQSLVGGYKVLNFSDIQYPQVVAQTDQISSAGLVLMKRQNAMISVDALSQDLIIYDISNFSQPTIISQFNILDGYNSETYLQLIQNESIVLICVPNQKFEIWRIANLYNPIYLSQVGNSFIDGFIISRDGNTIYTAADDLGIQIFDISDATMPELISIYQDGSEIVGIDFYGNQDYILGASQSGSWFKCIQVSDPKNPTQFGLYNQLPIPNFPQYINQINNISVIQWDGELQFISVGNNEIIGVELFIQFQNSSTLTFQEEAKALNRGVFVGENAQLMLTVFGDLYANTVKTVQISTSTGLQALPNWITFQQDSQLLTISAVKEGEGSLVFVLSIYSQVLNTDFQFVRTNISKAIYVDLQKIGYIDQNGFIISTINLDDDLIFSQSYLQQYSQMTMNVLINKIYAIPQQIFIISSLYFYPSSPQMVISSNSTQLTFQISTNVQNGQFMDVQLNGIIVSISNNQDTIILSGQIQQINDQVHNIRFNSLNPLSQIQCQIIIQDSLNYPYTNNNYTMDQLTFIKQNFKPQLNSPLQAQFNNRYPNSKIYITDQFTFVFSSDTFIDKDDVDTYTVQILENGNWITLDSTFWIIFSSQGMSFQGTPTKSMWNQEFTIKVIATDGYAECSDTFTLKCSLVPFDLVMSYIVAIGGPLVTVLGLIQYRAQIYNVWMRKKKEIEQIGESKLFQFLFVGEKLEEANTILSKIEQNLKQSYTKFIKLSKQELFKMMEAEEQTKIENDLLLQQIILNIYYDRLMNSQVLYKLVYEHLPRKMNIDGKSFYKTKKWWKKYTEIIWNDDQFLPEIRVDTKKLAKKISKIIKTEAFIKDLIKLKKSNSKINTEDIQVVEKTDASVSQIQTVQTSNLDLAFLQKNEANQSQTNKLDISIFEQCIIGEIFRSYTINSKIQELFAVKIFRKIHFTKCSCLMKLVEFDLQPLEMDGNKPLPDWIQMKKLDDTLKISVAPLEFDAGVYVFRILENGLYLLSEFEVEVARSDANLLQDSLHKTQKHFQQIELQQVYNSQQEMDQTQNNSQQQDISDSENQLTNNSLVVKRNFNVQFLSSKSEQEKKVADLELQQLDDSNLEPKQSKEQINENAFEISL